MKIIFALVSLILPGMEKIGHMTVLFTVVARKVEFVVTKMISPLIYLYLWHLGYKTMSDNHLCPVGIGQSDSSTGREGWMDYYTSFFNCYCTCI